MYKKRSLPLIFIFLVLLSIPLTLKLVSQSQDIRNQAYNCGGQGRYCCDGSGCDAGLRCGARGICVVDSNEVSIPAPVAEEPLPPEPVVENIVVEQEIPVVDEGELEVSTEPLIDNGTIPAEISPTQVVGVLNFKFSFNKQDPIGGCADNWPINVRIVDSKNNEMTYDLEDYERIEDDSGVIKYGVSINLSGLSENENLAVFVKGPKHIWTKYGENNQDGYYAQSGGKISITNDIETTPIYDFTNYPVLAGDINGDGVINGKDFSLIKSKANVRERGDDGEYMVEDLDGNCLVNSRDVASLLLSLQENYGQMY